MLPRLVPEILILYAFCDAAAAGAGIGDSRSLTNYTLEILFCEMYVLQKSELQTMTSNPYHSSKPDFNNEARMVAIMSHIKG